MYTHTVTGVELVALTPEPGSTLNRIDTSVVSCIEVRVSGINGSMTPQFRQEMDGDGATPPTATDSPYYSLASGAWIAAGVAITADGTYLWDTPGQVALLNVTAQTGTCTLRYKPLQGCVPGGTSSGGGGAVTLASGAVASGAYSAGSIAAGAAVDGWDLTQGTKADAAVTNPASSASEIAALKGILTLLAAAIPAGNNNIGDVDVATLPALVASAAYIGHVGGTSPAVAVEITRPADTTAYAVNDSVNTSTSAPTIITFAGASRVASGTGRIIKARLTTDQAACVAQMRVWIFNVSNPQLSNDNAAFLIKYADKNTRLGFLDFPALATEAGSDCAEALLDKQLFGFTADSSSQLYALLETKTIFTPASGQKFNLTLTFDQD